VALTAVARDGISPEVIKAVERVFAASSAPIVHRTCTQIEQLFDGVTLTPPGIRDVYLSARARIMGGVGVR
jgi:hypothetical protein